MIVPQKMFMVEVSATWFEQGHLLQPGIARFTTLQRPGDSLANFPEISRLQPDSMRFSSLERILRLTSGDGLTVD